ncbi:uncharacterized protein LOC124863132 [Girardinichthys multiradiatus]|uniref:uncharacterized protein LOC124863132 n=1 Tax=Girardinichthys multiradiatus TaxID=208333 RepID=UPI001FACC336|nr:uncharacterized protein LOC124863132 [Girardinichthys multiradiatus]
MAKVDTRQPAPPPAESPHLLRLQPASSAVVQSPHLPGLQPASSAVVQSPYLSGLQPASSAVVQSTHLPGLQPASSAVVQPTHLPGLQPASSAVVPSTVLSGLPGQTTSSEQVAVDEHNRAGMDRVDVLAEYLVELRKEKGLTLTNQQANTIVGKNWSKMIKTGFCMLHNIRNDCSLVDLGHPKKRLFMQELKAQKGVYLVLLVLLLNGQIAADLLK